jgi:uncharacterized protein (TIGR02145 family)
MKNLKLLLIALSFIVPLVSFSQIEDINTGGDTLFTEITDCPLDADKKSRSYKDFKKIVEYRMQQKSQMSLPAFDEDKHIGVVVNIIHNGYPIGYGDNFSDEAIINMIAELNQAYQPGNTVSGNIAPQEDTGFNFFLAFEDENGNPMVPIRRFDRTDPALYEKDPNTTADDWPAINANPFAYLMPQEHGILVTSQSASVNGFWNQFMRDVGYETDKFMNITIVSWNQNSGLGGVGSFPWMDYTVNSSLPGGGTFHPRKNFGLLLQASLIGNPDYTPYYLFAHEMGHCLGLLHTFQSNACPIAVYANEPTCADLGDEVCDTPPVFATGNFCGEVEPYQSISGCSEADAQQYIDNMNSDARKNYMDYVSFCDWYIFTPGQIEKAHNDTESGRQLMIAVGSAIASNQVGTGGCTDVIACNYNGEAQWNNGSCDYPNYGYNCFGDCLSDTDGDGVCDLNEVIGCMDNTKCNYNPEATDPGVCQVEDTCGVCGGPGDIYDCGCEDLPEFICDCVSGGYDYNQNGICDTEETYAAPGAEVTQVQITECPGDFDLSLMLDISGSMEEYEWQSSLTAIRDIVNYFYPLFEGNHLRLGFFGWSACDNQVEWLAPNSSWSQANILLDYLESIPAPDAGDTKLSAALAFAYDQFTDISVYNPNSTKVMIVISDGNYYDYSSGHMCSQADGAIFPLIGSISQFADKIKTGQLQTNSTSRVNEVPFKIMGIVIPDEPDQLPMEQFIERMEKVTNAQSVYPVTSYETIIEILPELGETFCVPTDDCSAITPEFIESGYVNPYPPYTQADKVYIPGNPAPTVTVNGNLINTTNADFGGWNRLISDINSNDGPHYIEAEYTINTSTCIFYDTLSCQLPIDFGPSYSTGWAIGTASDQHFVFKPRESDAENNFIWYHEHYNLTTGEFAPYVEWELLFDSDEVPVQNKLGEIYYSIGGEDITDKVVQEGYAASHGGKIYKPYRIRLNQMDLEFLANQTYTLEVTCSYGCTESIDFVYTVPPVDEEEVNPCSPFDINMQISYLGETYDLVTIGNRCWFVQDLRSSMGNNGQNIFYAEDKDTWNAISQDNIPAYTIANADDALEMNIIDQDDYVNGQWSNAVKMYNWFVLDNVCPSGWHPANNSDWNDLEASLFNASPLKLRSESQTIEDPNINIKDSLMTYTFINQVGYSSRFLNGEWPDGTGTDAPDSNKGLGAGVRVGATGDYREYEYSSYWWTLEDYPARPVEFNRQNSAWARGFTITEDFDNMYDFNSPGWKIDEFGRYMNLWSTSNNKRNALKIKCVKDIE